MKTLHHCNNADKNLFTFKHCSSKFYQKNSTMLSSSLLLFFFFCYGYNQGCGVRVTSREESELKSKWIFRFCRVGVAFKLGLRVVF